LRVARRHSLTRNRVAEIEGRIARHDLKNVYKEDRPTPCMLVDQEIFEANLRKMATHCRATGIHLRGHVKVHKSTEIATRQIALGGLGVTCATLHVGAPFQTKLMALEQKQTVLSP
jgi:hypothetical protein